MTLTAPDPTASSTTRLSLRRWLGLPAGRGTGSGVIATHRPPLELLLATRIVLWTYSEPGPIAASWPFLAAFLASIQESTMAQCSRSHSRRSSAASGTVPASSVPPPDGHPAQAGHRQGPPHRGRAHQVFRVRCGRRSQRPGPAARPGKQGRRTAAAAAHSGCSSASAARLPCGRRRPVSLTMARRCPDGCPVAAFGKQQDRIVGVQVTGKLGQAAGHPGTVTLPDEATGRSSAEHHIEPRIPAEFLPEHDGRAPLVTRHQQVDECERVAGAAMPRPGLAADIRR